MANPGQKVSLLELPDRMEVDDMNGWDKIQTYPRWLKRLQLTAWMSPWPRMGSKWVDSLERVRVKTGVAVVLVALLNTSTAIAQPVVLEDHFDDGVLDSAWEVSFVGNALGWSAVESGTNLTASDIQPLGVYCDTGCNNWAYVTLTRNVPPLGDFHVEIDFSWDSAGNNSAQQLLMLELLDANGSRIAFLMYRDAWLCCSGSQTQTVQVGVIRSTRVLARSSLRISRGLTLRG